MKVAATFLLSVTMFATLFLESSTTPQDTVDKVIGCVEDVVNDIVGAVVGKDIEAVKLATNTVAMVPIERVVSTIKTITGEVKGALSAALNKIESTLRREQVNAVQEMVTNVFVTNNAALDEIIKAFTEALAKVKGADKKILTQVLNWLKPLVDLSASVENTINDALVSDTAEDLQNAITILDQAIVEAQENLDKFVGILDASPSKPVNSVKAVVKNNMDSILVYANANLEAMRTLLPEEEQVCNAAA